MTEITIHEPMTKPIWSYPKVHALGHPAIRDLLIEPTDPIFVQEKLDGSQFSMMEDPTGVLHVRSKSQMLFIPPREKMFDLAVTSAVELHKQGKLIPGYVYRCEYLSKPKHNTLRYSREPSGFLAVFDIEIGPNDFMHPDIVRNHCHDIGLEYVPMLSRQHITGVDDILALLERESFLGNAKIEGVVIKNYGRFGRDGKVLMGKYVSEAFKESHSSEWKKSNPGQNDVIQGLILANRTEARWNKAVQHLAERGILKGEPSDIGPLLKELHADIDAECREPIAEALVKYAMPKIKRGVAAGFAEWYKQKLAEAQFEQEPKPDHTARFDKETGTAFVAEDQFVTKKGTVLDDNDIEEMALEAEHGYDLGGEA